VRVLGGGGTWVEAVIKAAAVDVVTADSTAATFVSVFPGWTSVETSDTDPAAGTGKSTFAAVPLGSGSGGGSAFAVSTDAGSVDLEVDLHGCYGCAVGEEGGGVQRWSPPWTRPIPVRR
jgi:hypothetical protein